MGAWGAGSFENDDAMDWVCGFSEAPSLEAVKAALTIVVELGDEYLELPECGAAIAAAEVVAAMKGAPNAGLPAELKAWIENQNVTVNQSLINLSLQALQRIKTNSEEQELWGETENPGEWYSQVNDLEARLRQ